MRVLARVVFLLSISICPYIAAQTPAVPLITRPIDESQLATLHGNVHPVARAEFDQGAAPVDLPMNRMLLVLKRSEAQETALRTLLDDQQDKASPNYHKWLTPEKFGREFGVSDQDIQQVTSWLQAHGFQIAQVSKGRAFIEFSGTAAQVQDALHAPIHKYALRGEAYWANARDPQIPAALAPVVAGVWSLHNFVKKPQLVLLDHPIPATYRAGAKPEVTFSNGFHALAPADYGVIYNIGPPPSGNAAKIAVLGRSNINVSQDVMAFHNVTSDGASTPQVVVNGPDPGNLGGGEEAEAVLDTTWSGAVARNAQVILVVSASTNTTDGVDLSELYTVDNNLADVMSESFGNCEASSTAAEAAAIASLAQQAAAQGITYTVSSGDSGAAGCDDPNTGTPASHPPSVNILASTPYTIAVGGSMFNENGQSSLYWNAANNQGNGESAVSYIPEKVWNESCQGAQCGSGGTSIWSGGGGPSAAFPQKPAWQAGFGDASRDTPDVSLTAAGHDPYLLCLDNSCTPNSQGFISFAGVGGTSASAPAFAGIMALVAEQTGSRQGQANYVLYRLAAAETYSGCNGSKPGGLASGCVFNDITIGNNSVPGDADYGSPTAKFQTSTGYDLATGLGSVSVTNLLNAWNTATFNATTTTASISPLIANHGAAVNVNVTVSGHGGTPSGSIWLLGSNQPSSLVGDNTLNIFPLDASGSVATLSHVLPGGTYQVTAHYAGDATYAPSNSSAIMVTVNPEPSTTSISFLTTDSNGNYTPYTSGPYGTPIYLKAHVAGRSGYGVPTSGVYFSSNQATYFANVNQNADAITTAISTFTPGSYSFNAQYAGDASFNASSSAPASFTVGKASTSTSLSVTPATQGATLTAILGFGGNGNPPSGTVTFYSGTTSLGSTSVNQSSFSNGSYQASAVLFLPQLANGQYSMTASYAGDTDYIASASLPLSVTLQPDFSFDPITAMTGSVPAGQAASFLASVSYNDGFAGTVSFTCAGLPVKATCTSTPLSSSGSETITIATTAPTTAVAHSLKHSGLSLWFTTLGGGFAAIFLLGVPRKSRHSVASAAAIALLLIAVGCGGGSTSTPVVPPTPQSVPGTPSGTYNITVTATGGTMTHSLAFVLTVK